MKNLVKIEEFFYEIYTNTAGLFDTPYSFVGIVTVLNETDDSLIDNWCYKKIGQKYKLHNNKLYEMWRYKKIDQNYEDDEQLMTIQRKRQK